MRIVFMGSPEFALPTLQGLIERNHEIVGVVTQPDRPAGRGRSLRMPPVAALAAEHGLTLLQPSNVNDEESLDALIRVFSDLVGSCSVAFMSITPLRSAVACGRGSSSPGAV